MNLDLSMTDKDLKEFLKDSGVDVDLAKKIGREINDILVGYGDGNEVALAGIVNGINSKCLLAPCATSEMGSKEAVKFNRARAATVYAVEHCSDNLFEIM